MPRATRLAKVRAGSHTGSSELLLPALQEGQPKRPSPLVPSPSRLRAFCTSGHTWLPRPTPTPCLLQGPVFQNALPAVSRAPPIPL